MFKQLGKVIFSFWDNILAPFKKKEPTTTNLKVFFEEAIKKIENNPTPVESWTITIPGRTTKEISQAAYREKNRQLLRDKGKTYRDKNKDDINLRKRQRRAEKKEAQNKEEISPALYTEEEKQKIKNTNLVIKYNQLNAKGKKNVNTWRKLAK